MLTIVGTVWLGSLTDEGRPGEDIVNAVPQFRKQIEHLEYRRVVWQYVIGALKTVHRNRLSGRRFGSDIELLAVYGAATVVWRSKRHCSISRNAQRNREAASLSIG